MPLELRTFSNGRDIDELVGDAACVQIERSGDASYDIVVANAAGGPIRWRLRTSRDGSIATELDGIDGATDFAWTKGDDDRLQPLSAACCHVHLENMSRRHYWMQLSFDNGEACRIDFMTPGYLKCVLAASN